MSHEVYDGMFTASREPAWHRLGKSYNEDNMQTATAALHDIGAHEVRIGKRCAGWLDEETMEFTPVDDRIFIVREAHKNNPVSRLGEASKDYNFMQNTDIARVLDASGLTSRYKVETMGVLHDGATLFTCMSMGEYKLIGERYHKYLLHTDTRDGSSAMQLILADMRVVCANTLMLAKMSGVEKFSLQHGANLQGDLEFGLSVIQALQEEAETVTRKLEALHDIPVTKADLEVVLEKTYPLREPGGLLAQYQRVNDPSKYNPADLERMKVRQDTLEADHRLALELQEVAKRRYEVLGQEYPVHKGNALGVLNAVAEVADHTRNRGASMASITGYRADEKSRCFSALVNL